MRRGGTGLVHSTAARSASGTRTSFARVLERRVYTDSMGRASGFSRVLFLAFLGGVASFRLDIQSEITTDVAGAGRRLQNRENNLS